MLTLLLFDRIIRSGVRLNTRETRVLNAMRDRRLDLIEELIKRLPGYKPPADYRCDFRVALLAVPQANCWPGCDWY